MTIKITVPEDSDAPELKPRISVIGVGGAGGNAVSNMIAANLEGCDFIVANTDAQSLKGSKAERRIQLGGGVTKGLGAGSKPEVGRAAAEESIGEVLNELGQSNMLFIAAGMGGGTGTGAAPVIAKAAREHGILTVGVVTKPFQFEGSHRMRLAEAGLDELAGYVDTLIIIPNQNLFRVANEKTTFADAFKMADDVLYSGVRSITDLMVMPGLINLDFADVQSVMSGMGRAMMGTGEAAGERRALDAAEAAISNPLLDDASMRGARGVLINITGGEDITLFEVDEAANRVRAEVDEDAYIIIGSAFDQTLEGTMRVSVVATGLEAVEGIEPSHLTMLSQTQRIEPVRVPRPAEEAGMAAQPDPAVAETSSPSMDAAAIEPATTESGDDIVAGIAGDAPPPSMESVESAPPPAAEPIDAEQAPLDPPMDGPVIGAPAAMPGSDNVEAFIPPKPMEVAEDGNAPSESQADPFDTAAMINGDSDDAGRPSKAAGLLRRVRKDRAKDGAKAGDKPSAKERGLSLFERVTGTGRARPEQPAAGPAPSRAIPHPEAPAQAASDEAATGGTIDALIRTRPPATTEPAATPAPVEPAATPEPVATMAPAESEKPALGGVDPTDRPAPPEAEDDLLDIPAFLRRQAN